MIDGHTYRISESLARRQIPTWELAQIHRVAFEHQPLLEEKEATRDLTQFHKVAFQFQAFPQEIESNQELTQILNIMQENRFDDYIREWEGLSRKDTDTLVNALVQYVLMCKRYFPTHPIKLPLSTMVSSFSIYKKLSGFNPEFENLLEIGPGVGNTLFFLKNHPTLKDYSFIEVCEAYYLLQSCVASYNFDHQFDERAFPQKQTAAQNTFTVCNDLEDPQYITVDFPARAHHYPWWRIGEVAEKTQHYDLVTSNANLTELSERALRDYLHLIKQCLKPQGALICQSLGEQLTRDTPQLIEIMKKERFGTLCISSETLPMEMRNGYQKNTCLRNAIFVAEGHPLYDEAVENMHMEYPFATDHYDPVFNAFYDNDTDRHMITSDEIKQLVREKLTHMEGQL